MILVCPRTLASKLWDILSDHAVTCNRVLYELLRDSVQAVGDANTGLQTTGLASRSLRGMRSESAGWLGTSTGYEFNQDGPFYHMLWSLGSTGEMPLEAQSAGFFVVGTCFHESGW